MVLDTLALVTLLFNEPEAEEFRGAGRGRCESLGLAATLLETAVIIEARKGEPGGDVFAYALSRTSGEPLLFKGDDFAKTDVGRVK